MNHQRSLAAAFCLMLLLTASSCGRKRLRAPATKDVGKALMMALREKNVDLLLAYYPKQSDCASHYGDFADAPAEADPSSDYSSYRKADDLDDKDVNRYFDNDLAMMKSDFKDVLDDGDEKGIEWKKAKFIRSELQPGSLKKDYADPLWIRVWGQAEGKRFCIVMYNALRTPAGWTCGLSMKLSDQVFDYHQGSDDEDDDE